MLFSKEEDGLGVPSGEDGLGVFSDEEGDDSKGREPFVELSVTLRNSGEGENDDTFV